MAAEDSRSCKTCGKQERTDICDQWVKIIRPDGTEEAHHAACVGPPVRSPAAALDEGR